MGIPGYGAILAMDDQQAVDFTNIAEVVNFSGPTISADTEDVTHHESPGAYREKVVTLLNAGQVAFVVGFEPDAPVDGKLAASVSLEITGQPTLA